MGWNVNYEIKFIEGDEDNKLDYLDYDEVKSNLIGSDISDCDYIFLTNEEDDSLEYNNVCIVRIYCGAFLGETTIKIFLKVLWNLYKTPMEYRKYGTLDYKKFEIQ